MGQRMAVLFLGHFCCCFFLFVFFVVFVFYFIKIPNFALPGVMLKFERGQYCRKKKKRVVGCHTGDLGLNPGRPK